MKNKNPLTENNTHKVFDKLCGKPNSDVKLGRVWWVEGTTYAHGDITYILDGK